MIKKPTDGFCQYNYNSLMCTLITNTTHIHTKLMQTKCLVFTENKYLPNTPSTDELAEKGMNLKELTVAQHESIEQLFLHIIALEKRIKELEAQK